MQERTTFLGMNKATFAVVTAALALLSTGFSAVALAYSFRAQGDAIRENHNVLCVLVHASVGNAATRQDVLEAADRLKALEAVLPPGPALEAVSTVEVVFRTSGTGSTKALVAFRAELARIGCPLAAE